VAEFSSWDQEKLEQIPMRYVFENPELRGCLELAKAINMATSLYMSPKYTSSKGVRTWLKLAMKDAHPQGGRVLVLSQGADDMASLLAVALAAMNGDTGLYGAMVQASRCGIDEYLSPELMEIIKSLN